MNLSPSIINTAESNNFSGTVLVKRENETIAEMSFGYANRSDQLKNNTQTRFGIASGCKIFTSIAICQLVEQGKLSFDTKLSQCLEVHFPNFDNEVTIHHLLTHTSGIPDYFDEEVMDDFEQLWIDNPMYRIRNLKEFLPLFKDQAMKFRTGERFHYNNAGYILLGLIVEQTSQQRFDEYVQEHIFDWAGMNGSGYFEFDAYPQNTALGYIEQNNGNWKTNIYSLPVKGGSDGGAFVTVNDMDKLWEALMNNHLLSKFYTEQLLTSHVHIENVDYYGYGVWIKQNAGGNVVKYHVLGYDPGVNFHSGFYPDKRMKVVVCSNKSSGAFDLLHAIEDEMKNLKD
ncbi:Putative penicillin-binding protein PbpX [Paenibacillus plantiphilus]|uniref:Penicillin-binding protein PbpX n=2 Tax=Paenibacillus plantiphilus TaxID=2905650 RepID=A0ABM9C0S5_9BACL|nr:serine hydrolase [Paenibacillus plantiphilus]CAH1197736.1 Putative penicillin-binding protein PbpX [Paenibacillus plantiphilus]